MIFLITNLFIHMFIHIYIYKIIYIKIHCAPIRQKLLTFMHINILYDIKVFFVLPKTFLINTTYIYLYITGPIFCKDVFYFCATLNIFSQHESLSVATKYFFVTYIILVQNVTSMWNIFFLTQQNRYIKIYIRSIGLLQIIGGIQSLNLCQLVMWKGNTKKVFCAPVKIFCATRNFF